MFKHLPDCPKEPHHHILVVDEDQKVLAIFTRTVDDPLTVQAAVKSDPDVLAEQMLRVALFLSMCVGTLLDDTGLSEIADEVTHRIIKSIAQEQDDNP